MKKIILSILIMTMAMSATGCNGCSATNNQSTTATEQTSVKKNSDTRIQVAILLDTSSSMDGLIEQAKSRLWNIVNTLTTLRYKGSVPYIEIALYEYGNNNIPAEAGYIRQVTPLTADLDLISEKLFSLTTYGGEEFCGAVIDKAVKALKWGNNPADMKLIYIAGNEPFTQGRVSYKTAINNALEKNIYIHTIHCGDKREGIRGEWKAGAEKGRGQFFNIDHNVRVRYYDTPYDDRINKCNIQLNATYIGYGAKGSSRKEAQVVQDQNARSISSANYAERAVSKTKKIYNNSSWDLVDKVKADASALDEIQEAELPSELQQKTKEELKILIAEKDEERTKLQNEISDLAKKRQAYIDEQVKKESNKDQGDDLGKAINQSVIDLALAMGYKVEE